MDSKIKMDLVYYTEEFEDSYQAVVMVPGVNKEDLSVVVSGNFITIDVKENDFVEEGTLNVLATGPLNKDNVYSKLEAGILRVGVVKVDDSEIEIEVN